MPTTSRLPAAAPPSIPSLIMSARARTAAKLATAGLVVIAAFQIALVAGMPWGAASWGGAHEGSLPIGLRISSAIATVVYGFFVVMMLERGRIRSRSLPAPLLNLGIWVLASLLGVGTLANLASSSGWERYLWAPFAACLCALCVVVARSPRIETNG